MSREDEEDYWADRPYCAFCGCWIESPFPMGRRRGGIGATICYDCARPEPTHQFKSDGNRREPSCIHCGRYRNDAVHRMRKPDEPAAVPDVQDGLGVVAGLDRERD